MSKGGGSGGAKGAAAALRAHGVPVEVVSFSHLKEQAVSSKQEGHVRVEVNLKDASELAAALAPGGRVPSVSEGGARGVKEYLADTGRRSLSDVELEAIKQDAFLTGRKHGELTAKRAPAFPISTVTQFSRQDGTVKLYTDEALAAALVAYDRLAEFVKDYFDGPAGDFNRKWLPRDRIGQTHDVALGLVAEARK